MPARLAGLVFPSGLQDQPLKSHVGMSNRCSPGTGVVNKNSLFMGRLTGGLGNTRMVSWGWDTENGPLGFVGLTASAPLLTIIRSILLLESWAAPKMRGHGLPLSQSPSLCLRPEYSMLLETLRPLSRLACPPTPNATNATLMLKGLL